MQDNFAPEQVINADELRRAQALRRVRRASVVLGYNLDDDTLQPVRGAGKWRDMLDGRADEWDLGRVLIVRCRGPAELVFLRIVESIAR